jgi:hypothetical protein
MALKRIQELLKLFLLQDTQISVHISYLYTTRNRKFRQSKICNGKNKLILKSWEYTDMVWT